MNIIHHDEAETVVRLRKHPVWTMDAQNVTADAADFIERQRAHIDFMEKELNEMLEIIGCGYPEMLDSCVTFRFEQLRSVLQSNDQEEARDQ